MKEVWKNIEGYKGIYQVSNFGRIKSLTRYVNHFKGGKKIINETILKEGTLHNGYKTVSLYKNGIGKTHLIHHLVYEAFRGKIPFWMQINHKDENPANNQLFNLMICTPKQNSNWGNRNIKISSKLTNGKSSKPVVQYDLNGNFIKEWKSTMEVQRQLGYSNSHISKCCLDNRKTAYGYIWNYK